MLSKEITLEQEMGSLGRNLRNALVLWTQNVSNNTWGRIRRAWRWTKTISGVFPSIELSNQVNEICDSIEAPPVRGMEVPARLGLVR
jgi:hypothetical protein